MTDADKPAELPARPEIWGGLFRTSPELSPLDRVNGYMEYICALDTNSHEKVLQRAVKCVAATPDGKAEFQFRLPDSLCNDRGALHGAAGGLIVDTVTLLALLIVAKPGFWAEPHETDPHLARLVFVTRTLNTTYLRPVMRGEKLRVTAEVLHVGQRQALLKCEVFEDRGDAGEGGRGKLLVYATHDVVNLAGMKGAAEKFRERKVVGKAKL